jgi:hypothetical protein
MTRSVTSFVLSAVLFGALGCHASTQAKFVVPPNSQLVVNGEPVTLNEDGSATMSAFGWGGASYKVTRDGRTVSSGKLDTKFRPISLIWPPFGVIYVPKGLDDSHTYDLTSKQAKQTSAK